MAEDNQPGLAELGRTTTRIEGRLDALHKHVDDRFDRMQRELATSITSLSVVHKDVYDADKQRYADLLADAKSTAESANTKAMWAIGLIVAFVLAALAGFVRLAG